MFSSNSQPFEGTLKFYQSGEVIYTPVDLNNPVHRQLVVMILRNELPNAKANDLMKKAGIASQKSWGGKANVASSDLWLWHSEYKHNVRAYQDALLTSLS